MYVDLLNIFYIMCSK